MTLMNQKYFILNYKHKALEMVVYHEFLIYHPSTSWNLCLCFHWWEHNYVADELRDKLGCKFHWWKWDKYCGLFNLEALVEFPGQFLEFFFSKISFLPLSSSFCH